MMHYLQDGKSWYQSHFNAYLADDDQHELNVAKDALNTAGITWDMLNNYFITTPLPLSENEMKHMFETSDTTLAFFQTLYTKIGIAKFCNFIAPWIELFMQKPRFPFSFRTPHFRIKTAEMPIMEFEWLSITEKRGGRRTRKRRNTHMRGAYF
jgi:hypothetical protein